MNKTEEHTKNKTYYGIIAEGNSISFSPRAIDSDDGYPVESFAEAFKRAEEFLKDGYENIKVVVARYSGAEEAWVEDWNYTAVEIDASSGGLKEFPFEPSEEDES